MPDATTSSLGPTIVVPPVVAARPSNIDAGKTQVRKMLAWRALRPTSLVVHVGSGEGELLAHYHEVDVPVLGIEPDARRAEVARLHRGLPTLCQAFTPELATQLEQCGQPADVIHAHDLLPFSHEMDRFVRGLRVLLKETGVAVLEVPYAKALDGTADHHVNYDGPCCVFTLTALDRLCQRHGLVLLDAETALGGRLRVYVGRIGEAAPRLRELLQGEAAWNR